MTGRRERRGVGWGGDYVRKATPKHNRECGTEVVEPLRPLHISSMKYRRPEPLQSKEREWERKGRRERERRVGGGGGVGGGGEEGGDKRGTEEEQVRRRGQRITKKS